MCISAGCLSCSRCKVHHARHGCVLQAQVQHMTKKYHIYMTMDGRISMAGLSGSSCKYLAEAMKDAVENVKA